MLVRNAPTAFCAEDGSERAPVFRSAAVIGGACIKRSECFGLRGRDFYNESHIFLHHSLIVLFVPFQQFLLNSVSGVSFFAFLLTKNKGCGCNRQDCD